MQKRIKKKFKASFLKKTQENLDFQLAKQQKQGQGFRFVVRLRKDRDGVTT